jgi:DnaJ-class molecular chaperone
MDKTVEVSQAARDAGEVQVVCPACDGEGEIEHPHMPLHHLHSECPEYAIVECDDCDGTGKIWKEV